MKTFNRKIPVLLIVIGLMSANVILFARSVSVSDSLSKMEAETQRLKTENQQLEQKLFSLNSLTRLDKVADYLGFTQSAKVLDLTPLKYAMNKNQ